MLKKHQLDQRIVAEQNLQYCCQTLYNIGLAGAETLGAAWIRPGFEHGIVGVRAVKRMRVRGAGQWNGD
jgi:hypothetical protein